MSQKTAANTKPAPADAAMPTVEPQAVCQLHRDFLESERFGGSSNDVAQMLDDWFIEQGFPTVLYRA
ncbi:MAG: hypothetical protein V7603_5169 [Micromonosporaceae bacterium]